MISYVKGVIADFEKDKVIIENNGIGYGIYMPQRSLGLLPSIGSEVKIYTYMNVREDAMQLFGFLNKDELDMYKLVITVSGIGPKGGLSILSTLSADDLRFAVLSSDVKAISAAPGIGKKTSEKLIIELKDKMDMDDILTHAGSGVEGATSTVPNTTDTAIQAEAAEALVALGYGSTEAYKAVKLVNIENPTVEMVLKEALKKMF